MTEFKKSSFSRPLHKGCIYVAIQKKAITIKKNFGGQTIRFTPYEWEVFIKGVKNGEFDLI